MNATTEITKIRLLKEVCNDMCHNFYYAVYGRIYNEDKTRYKKFHFVVWFDAFDIQENAGRDYYTKQDKKELLDLYAMSFCDMVTDYNNVTDFYNACNDTINRYNGTNY